MDTINVMKVNKPFYPALLILFLFSQSVFSVHQLNHLEGTDHPETCFVCELDSSVFWNLSREPSPHLDFKQNFLFERKFLIFSENNLYCQVLPRPPPLNQILKSAFI